MTLFKNTLALSIAGLFVAGPAFALDGYRSRKGLLYGAGFGLGAGKIEGQGSDQRLGYTLRLRAGGGITEKLTLDFELGMHKAEYEYKVGPATVDISNQLVTGGLGLNFFVVDNLYVRGTMGLARFAVDVGGVEESDTQFFVGGGLGYEFFANSDLALGIGSDVVLSSVKDNDFQLVTFGLTLTHY